MQYAQYYLITMCKMAGRAGLCLVRRARGCCSSADEAGLVLELGKARCRVMSLLRLARPVCRVWEPKSEANHLSCLLRAYNGRERRARHPHCLVFSLDSDIEELLLLLLLRSPFKSVVYCCTQSTLPCQLFFFLDIMEDVNAYRRVILLQIEATVDILCPWSYMQKKALDKAMARYRQQNAEVSFQVVWKPFYVNAELEGGTFILISSSFPAYPPAS